MTQKSNTHINTINIALYQPDIPQNTGAKIRLCSCFDVKLEIIEPCGFVFDEKRIKRVAMDYYDSAKIIKHKSYDDFLKDKKNSRLILMTTRAKKSYYKFKFKPMDVILFGRESAGVPEKVHKQAHQSLKIPLKNKSRSLNIVTVAAITIAEALKQNYFFND